MMHSTDLPSTKPYLLRAIYEWCSDNGLTPYVAVKVDASVRVPMEFVKDGEIVLNVSMDATSALQMDNDYISFKARFGGQPRAIWCPSIVCWPSTPVKTDKAWPSRSAKSKRGARAQSRLELRSRTVSLHHPLPRSARDCAELNKKFHL